MALVPRDLYYEQCAKMAQLQHELDIMVADNALLKYELQQSKALVDKLTTAANTNGMNINTSSGDPGGSTSSASLLTLPAPTVLSPPSPSTARLQVVSQVTDPPSTTMSKRGRSPEGCAAAAHGALGEQFDEASEMSETLRWAADALALRLAFLRWLRRVCVPWSTNQPAAEPTTVTWLDARYDEKEHVKALGAQWDDTEKRWFAPSHVDTAPLTPWLEVSRVYLECPYAQKEEAKASGANWDKASKRWFVNGSADLQKFAKWLPRADE